MRNVLFLLALVIGLVACDDGSRPPITNSNPVQRVLPSEPPLDEDVEIPIELDPESSPMFEREFDGRLSTPRPLFEDEDDPEPEPTPAFTDAVIAEPTATTSLFGTPFPTRGGFPTSTPYQ